LDPATTVVTGAGIAGLSAAHDLQRAGHRVVVLERDAWSGGRMADSIAHGSLERIPRLCRLLALITEVGTEQDIAWLSRAGLKVDFSVMRTSVGLDDETMAAG
jgi:monoamine oxidase